MSSVQILRPRGRDFVRGVILRGLIAGDQYATTRWGSAGVGLAKAATPALNAGEVGVAAREVFGLVREQALIGRMGLRQIPMRVRMVSITSGASAFWVTQGKPRPLSKIAVMGDQLKPATVSAIICVTKEGLEIGGEITESALQADLLRAVSETIDSALIDASNAGIPGETPAAITYGVDAIESVGDPAADIAALIAAFAGDFASATFVTDPKTAAEIALARDAGGAFAFPDAGPRGGSILGIPLLTSRASPRTSEGGQIALVDGSGIAFGYEGGSMDSAQHATLQMSDDPENDPGTLVNLWQSDTVAFRADQWTNWEVQREGSVAVVSNAAYVSGAGT